MEVGACLKIARNAYKGVQDRKMSRKQELEILFRLSSIGGRYDTKIDSGKNYPIEFVTQLAVKAACVYVENGSLSTTSPNSAPIRLNYEIQLRKFWFNVGYKAADTGTLPTQISTNRI